MSAYMCAGLVVSMICAVVSSSADPATPLADCSSVADHFVRLGLGLAANVPKSRVHDGDMEVCYRGSHDTSQTTCCTRMMERKYHVAAEELYIAALRDTSSYLKNLMTANTALYQNKFMSRLEESANATQEMLSSTYQIPAARARAHLDTLFLDLHMFLRQRHVSIHDSLTQFFDNLFPMVFRYALNDPTLMDRHDEDFSECLAEIREDLSPNPFGDIPNHLSRQLESSLSSARVFLEAMHLGIETLNTTDYFSSDHSCSRALTRLTYCSHCHGYVQVSPCHGLCMNVLRGCLAHTAGLSGPWDDYVAELQALAMHMRGSFDIDESMTGFADHVSDAILHAMEKAHLYFPEVVKRCGHPKTSGDTPANRRPHARPRLLPSVSGSEVKLHDKLAMLMRHLVASKGFYARLPDTVCGLEELADHGDGQCWNGHSLGSYDGEMIGPDVDSQVRNNPEVRVSPVTPPAIAIMADKLQHMTKVLVAKSSEALTQSDQSWSTYGEYDVHSEYSGDWRRGQPVDDEDSYGSGSGSGYDWDVSHDRTSNNHQFSKDSGPEGPRNSNPDDGFRFDDNPPSPYSTARSNTHHDLPGDSTNLSFSVVMVTISVVTSLSMWLNG